MYDYYTLIESLSRYGDSLQKVNTDISSDSSIVNDMNLENNKKVQEELDKMLADPNLKSQLYKL
ncbi:MAG: hypothetical protein WBA17_07215 [Saprospiraceae bacterium]